MWRPGQLLKALSHFSWRALNLIVKSYDIVSLSIFSWQLINHQNYVPKLPQNTAPRKWKYILQMPKLAYTVPFARRDTRENIILVHTPFMNIPGGSVVQIRHNQFLNTKTEWPKRLTCTVTWHSVAILCAPLGQTIICAYQKPPGWIQMVVTRQMTVTSLFFGQWRMF